MSDFYLFPLCFAVVTARRTSELLPELLADENGVSIKIAKYAGMDKVDLIQNEEYGYCSLIKATHQVLEKLKIENSTMVKVTSTKRIEKNLVDPIPLREAVINAIVHSDYSREIPPVFEIFSDRMVFTSYGGLIPGQSEQDFFSCSSMPRNRELMRVFKDVGLVEQLGSGMSRILKSYDKNIFHITDHFIKVEFPFAIPEAVPIIASGNDNGNEISSDNDYEKKALDILSVTPSITAKGMAEQMGMSVRKMIQPIRAMSAPAKRGHFLHWPERTDQEAKILLHSVSVRPKQYASIFSLMIRYLAYNSFPASGNGPVISAERTI